MITTTARAPNESATPYRDLPHQHAIATKAGVVKAPPFGGANHANNYDKQAIYRPLPGRK
jgi:hypothetical protein